VISAPVIRRIGWRGVAIELHAPERVWTALAPHLPAFYDADGEVVATGYATSDGDRLTVELPEELGFFGVLDEETLRAVSSRLELLVCTHLPDRIAVHAGAVSVQDRAIVLPGSSMAGKSTLVAALLEHGATYFSDEFALIDEQGLVWPYPRRMTLRGAGARERVLPAGAADASGPPMPLGLLAHLRYADEGWQVSELSAAQGVLALMENAPAARVHADRALRALTAAVAQRPPVVQGTRGAASDAARHLLDILR
jgi:hypothetical protein